MSTEASVLALIRERRYTAAINLCDEVLASRVSTSTKVAHLILKARALADEDGRWSGPAVACLKDALEMTPEGSEERAKVLTALTAAYAALGSLGFVQKYRLDLKNLAGIRPSPRLQSYLAHADYNLALAIHQVEELEAAISWYCVARNAYEQLEPPCDEELLFDIDLGLIDAHQEMGEYVIAKKIMDRVFPRLSDEEYGAAIRLRNAEYALHQGDPDAALLWVESGLGHRSCDLKTRAALTLAKAKIALYNEDPANAHDFGLEALRLAALSKSTHLSDRVSRFLKSVSKGGS